MNDSNATIKDIKKLIHEFVDERDWSQFHSPKNCSMNIAIEAAELMEKFQWCDNKESYRQAERNIKKVEEELADVFITAFQFARTTNIDITKAIIKKLAKNSKNYPVEKAKGNCTKYTEL